MVRFSIDCTLPFSPQDFWRLRDAPSFIRFIVSDGMLKKMTVTPPVPDAHGWMTRKQHYCPARVDCPDIVRAIVGDTMFDVVDEQRWNEAVRPHHLHFTIKPSFLAALSSTHGELSVEPLAHPAPNSDDSESDGDARPQRPDPPTDANQRARHADDDASDDAGSERDDADTGSSLSDAGAPDCDDALDEDPALAIAALPARDKAVHLVKGVTRVRILTVGWFVERAIVHNLRRFYQEYPATVLRFRHWLYDQFADGDRDVPVSLVIDRFLESEAALIERERLQKEKEADQNAGGADEPAEAEAEQHEEAQTQRGAACLGQGRACDSGDMSSVTTTTSGGSPQSDSSDGLSSD